jgi:hypothetical protein
VVSSVTYADRQAVAAREVDRLALELEHARPGPSPRRTGGSASEPMKVRTSISMPTFCEMSTIAWMSLTWVRAAQAGLIAASGRGCGSAMIVQSSTARLPAPGSPMSIVVDAEVGGQLEEPQLVLDGRVDHRRRLDAVAQRLVEEGDLATTKNGIVTRWSGVDHSWSWRTAAMVNDVAPSTIATSPRAWRTSQSRGLAGGGPAGRSDPGSGSAMPRL